MKTITKRFAEIFGKIIMIAVVATAFFASSFLTTSFVSACDSCEPVHYNQCFDELDNDGDDLWDSADPGCHTDYNPNNPASYDETDDDESDPITIVATKIVCDDELYLPNWGAEQTPITGETVSIFLDGNEHCSIDPDWKFQWAPEGIGNPGDNTGESLENWTTFLEATQIDFSVVENLANVWVREVWDDSYVPFTGANTTENESAEIYCHTDTINYDNYDSIDSPFVAGETYYCVAFNAEVEVEVNTPPVITLTQPKVTITIGDSFNSDDYATADDLEDGDITDGIIVSGDVVDVNTLGTYYVLYDVVDSKGLSADTKTLEVVVENETPNLCRVDLDVVILLDKSGSMDDDSFDPAQPLTNAKNAANGFVDKLGLDDRSALVSFDTEAFLQKGLSNDHTATKTAINALASTGATNLGDAINLANGEFSTSSQATKIEIILSDGEANKYTDPDTGELVGPGFESYGPAVDFAKSKAEEANAQGVKIFTIGLGDSVDTATLQSIAELTGGEYYYAPSSEDLDEIFDQISLDVCKFGSVSGCVYEAENRTDTEGTSNTLANWEIILGGDANLSQLTDANGLYQFSGLAAGDYTISQAVNQAIDYIQTFPATSTYSVSLDEEETESGYKFVDYLPTCGNDILDIDFGEQCDDGNDENGDGCSSQCLTEEVEPDCSISGHKYENSTEENLEGWTIGLAQILSCSEENSEWADSVVSYSPAGVIDSERKDSQNALGVAQRDDSVNFVSLGIGGSLVLEFDNIILNGDGDDVEVVETSFGNPTCQDYPEKIKVFASQDGSVWTEIGTGCLDSTYDLGSLEWAKYIKIVDITNPDDFSSDYDGFDVDGVRAIHCGIYSTIETTQTNEDGYCFSKLEAGKYFVFEEMQPNWSIVGITVGDVSVNYHTSYFDAFVGVDVGIRTTTFVDFWNQKDSPVNTPPVILGADNPLIFYVGDINTVLELEALARLGVTATDTEDGILTGDIEITGLGSVATSTVGTSTISYDVDDYGDPILSASTVVREVRVVTQCSDEIDNDDDGTIDEDDLTCWRDGEYDPEINNEENQKPVITLTQSTLTITVGGSFDLTSYATADDLEDGDITNNITASSTVDTATVGTYHVVYDVVDSEGLAADTKTLEVIVTSGQGPTCGDLTCNGTETCSTCPTDCGSCPTGGGGGGGWYVTILAITNETINYLGNGTALVTWNTNVPATSQVVYGDSSIEKSNLGSSPKYGYDSVNEKSSDLVTSHSMLITGLTHGTQYYFRPVSEKSGVGEAVGKELTYFFLNAPACNYLLEYIKLGAVNNPVEVTKLEKFLNEFENENLLVNGIYEQADYEAVERFQIKYREDVLDPWGHEDPTGYVYITTKKKINEIYCQKAFPLTVSEEGEVAAFRALIESMRNPVTGEIDINGVLEGIEDLNVGDTVGTVDNANDNGLAGLLANASSSTGTEALLADISSGTGTSVEVEKKPGLLANVLNAIGFGDDQEEEQGSQNLASAIYSGMIGLVTSFWFILLLVMIAIILFFNIRKMEDKK